MSDSRILTRWCADGVVHDVQVDGAGGRLVVQAGDEGVRVCELSESGKLSKATPLEGTSVPASGWLPEVALHPHAPLAVVSCEDRPLMVFDLESGRKVTEFGEVRDSGPRRGFWAVAFSHDGEYVETHSLGPERGERYSWRSGELVGKRWGPGGLIARTPEDGVLAVCQVDDWTGAVHFGRWCGADFEWFEPMIHTIPVTRVRAAPNLLALYGGTSRLHLQVHDFPSLEPRYCLLMDLLGVEDAEDFEVGNALGISPTGDLIFVPTADGVILMLCPRDAREIGRWRAHDGMVLTCDVHPHRPWVITGGVDGDVVVAETRKCDATAPRRETTEQAFAARFELVSGSPGTSLSAFLGFEAPLIERGTGSGTPLR